MSSNNQAGKIAIAVHGGAGTISRAQMTAEKEAAYKKACALRLNAA